MQEPEFVEPIDNLTIAVGREAVLSCTVSNLGKYKVRNMGILLSWAYILLSFIEIVIRKCEPPVAQSGDEKICPKSSLGASYSFLLAQSVLTNLVSANKRKIYIIYFYMHFVPHRSNFLLYNTFKKLQFCCVSSNNDKTIRSIETLK